MSPPPPDNTNSINAPLTLSELSSAISSISSAKVSVGPDGISYEMIRRFPPAFLSAVLTFFQHCFTTGTLPAKWNHSHVVPIHKQGKPRNDASSYRPISLTSHLSKIYERIIKSRLAHYLERNSTLPDCQAGFPTPRADRRTDRPTITQYADDLAMWFDHNTKRSHSHKTKRHFQLQVQKALDAVHAYMARNGFALAPEKTQLIHFAATKDTYKPALSLNNTPLTETNQAKFLGVLFTTNLDWAPHIHSLTKKAAKALNLMKVCLREPWGRNSKTLLHLATALVRSRLQYGQECFHAAPPSLLHKLTSVDARAVKLALGLPIHCSSNAAYAEAELLPLPNLRQLAVAKVLTRSFAVTNTSTKSILLDQQKDSFKATKKKRNYLSPNSTSVYQLLADHGTSVEVAKRFYNLPGCTHV
nr:hypothetical protein BaRGS_003667 [Batillaria attramentaria]